MLLYIILSRDFHLPVLRHVMSFYATSFTASGVCCYATLDICAPPTRHFTCLLTIRRAFRAGRQALDDILISMQAYALRYATHYTPTVLRHADTHTTATVEKMLRLRQHYYATLRCYVDDMMSLMMICAPC